jgi:nucleosome binding factor SPN SPT16 subunit
VGIIAKDRYKGRVVDEWTKAVSTSGASYEEVDISAAISACVAVKDDEELVWQSMHACYIYTHP